MNNESSRNEMLFSTKLKETPAEIFYLIANIISIPLAFILGILFFILPVIIPGKKLLAVIFIVISVLSSIEIRKTLRTFKSYVDIYEDHVEGESLIDRNSIFPTLETIKFSVKIEDITEVNIIGNDKLRILTSHNSYTVQAGRLTAGKGGLGVASKAYDAIQSQR